MWNFVWYFCRKQSKMPRCSVNWPPLITKNTVTGAYWHILTMVFSKLIFCGGIIQDPTCGCLWNASEAALRGSVLCVRPSENPEFTLSSFTAISNVIICDAAIFCAFEQWEYRKKKSWQFFTWLMPLLPKMPFCHHELDFGLKATSTFLSTFHEKVWYDKTRHVVRCVTEKTSMRKVFPGQALRASGDWGSQDC